MTEKGLVHIYCGEGKGKTTAAIGLGLRASGCGYKVFMLQFLKSSNCSEHTAIRQLSNFTISNVDESIKFVFQLTESEKAQLAIRSSQKLQQAFEMLKNKAADMLILDEVLGAIECGILDQNQLLHLIKERPFGSEIVLTGRAAQNQLIEIADYVSSIEKVKHPYDKGMKARKGIEW